MQYGDSIFFSRGIMDESKMKSNAEMAASVDARSVHVHIYSDLSV